MEAQFVEGDYGYILWTAETSDNRYELGTDTFVVRDGEIRGSIIRRQDHAEELRPPRGAWAICALQ